MHFAYFTYERHMCSIHRFAVVLYRPLQFPASHWSPRQDKIQTPKNRNKWHNSQKKQVEVLEDWTYRRNNMNGLSLRFIPGKRLSDLQANGIDV
ncbi:hypothetical protein EVAR_51300_1 [Eumeta japonica]|uniref:Uncharacterized protein n=1 Tax=Eumeta variegata TaxID=151549 RepID=A0A4C1XQJ3_EUMVA|nr:hypothetical protein EVAR_51300_1 [Eumeta japonica]